MNKFENKIKMLIHAIILFVLSISVLFTYFVIMRIYDEDYLIKTREFVQQYNKRTEYFIEELEKNAQTVAVDEEIKKALKEDILNPEANNRLNEITIMNENIIGITVYGEKSTYASDSVLGSIPPKDYIIDTYNISDFLKSEKRQLWLLRSGDTYTDFYRQNNWNYKITQGLYSFFCKIYHEGECVGFVLLDTNVEKLFDVYPDNNFFIGNPELFIKNEAMVVSDSGNKNSEYKENDVGMTEISHKLLNSDNYVVVQVDKASAYKGMIPVMMIIILFALAWYILCIPYCKFIVSSISIPINKLGEKISEYNNGEKNE